MATTQLRAFVSISRTLKKKDVIYLFLSRGEGREKHKERNISVWLPHTHPLSGTWPATQACALTGYRNSDPLVCRPVLNPLSHTSQGAFSFFKDSLCMVLLETLLISTNSLLKYVWMMCYDSNSLYYGWLSYFCSIKELESLGIFWFGFLFKIFLKTILGLISFFIY